MALHIEQAGTDVLFALKLAARQYRSSDSQISPSSSEALLRALQHFAQCTFAWRYIVQQNGALSTYFLVRTVPRQAGQIASKLQTIVEDFAVATPVSDPLELRAALTPFEGTLAIQEVRSALYEVDFKAASEVLDQRLFSYIPCLFVPARSFQQPDLIQLLKHYAPIALNVALYPTSLTPTETAEFARLSRAAGKLYQVDYRGSRYTDENAAWVASIYRDYPQLLGDAWEMVVQVVAPDPAPAQNAAEDLIKAAIDQENQQGSLLSRASLYTPADTQQQSAARRTFTQLELQRWNTVDLPEKLLRLSYLTNSVGASSMVHLPAPIPIADQKVRILFLAANPRNTSTLRLGEESRLIEERLKLAHLRGCFEFSQHHALRWEDMVRYLMEEQPNIVHFSGHGGSSELIFEDAAGNAQPIPTSVLGQLFGILKDRVRCVVLNACWSKAQAAAIVNHIDYVVGMDRPIEDPAAIGFAGGFYQALGGGRTIQEAFELGRLELAVKAPASFEIPHLLVRQGVRRGDDQPLCSQ